MRDTIAREMKEHADEELGHAQILTQRIIQLGGTPLLKPSEWQQMSNCDYITPNNPAVKSLLMQNIKAEQCAIDVYHKLAKTTKDIDAITYHLALKIMNDEINHEEDLETLLADLNSQ